MSASSTTPNSPDGGPADSLAPRLPLRPLRLLAPKPLQPRPSPTSSGTHTPGPYVCPICRHGACQLTSHKAFAKRQQGKKAIATGNDRLRQQGKDLEETTYTSSYAYLFAAQYLDAGISASRLDPFITLPVPNGEHPDISRLFHHFFTVQLNNVVTFPRPAAFSSDLVGGAIATAAMIDSVLCLSVLSAASVSLAMKKNLSTRTAMALSFNGQAMQSLRERLISSPGLPTDATIMAATILWALSVPFGDLPAAESHGNAVSALVAQRGGLSSLGMAGVLAQVILWSDAHCALFLMEEPRFEHTFHSTFLQEPPEQVYGQAFEDDRILESVQPSVGEICLAASRLIELLEKANDEGSTAHEYLYFISKLDELEIHRAIICSKLKGLGTKDECVGIALEILVHNVIWLPSHHRSLTLEFCSRLQTALIQTDISTCWDDEIDLLRWILFVVGTVSPPWDGKKWFIDLLHRAVSFEYSNDEEWPFVWKDKELQNLKRFVWSEVRLEDACRKVCAVLERQNLQELGSESS